jgi:hypothetical protein
MIRRREFVTLLGGAAAVRPVGAQGQSAQRIWRIGFLRAAPPSESELGAFLRALAVRGYVQGHNFVLVPQWGDGNVERLSELAIAMVNSRYRYNCHRGHNSRTGRSRRDLDCPNRDHLGRGSIHGRPHKEPVASSFSRWQSNDVTCCRKNQF